MADPEITVFPVVSMVNRWSHPDGRTYCDHYWRQRLTRNGLDYCRELYAYQVNKTSGRTLEDIPFRREPTGSEPGVLCTKCYQTAFEFQRGDVEDCGVPVRCYSCSFIFEALGWVPEEKVSEVWKVEN